MMERGRVVLKGQEKRRVASDCLMGREFRHGRGKSPGGRERDGCMTTWMHVMPLNCPLENG